MLLTWCVDTQVFWAVVERGGYEAVTNGKLWKDICRCLPVDLTGQTSASYNMRINYERCLLDFENYLACGQVMMLMLRLGDLLDLF